MAAIYRIAKCFGKTIQLPGHNRNISLSASRQLKEIVEKKDGDTLVIEGVIKKHKNEDQLVKLKNGACPICSTNLNIKHTDVLILSQFMTSDGCILPRRVTGLCETQQRRISVLVVMAQKAGLMPTLAPPNSHCDPSRRRKWKKFNTYYDETTIKARYK